MSSKLSIFGKLKTVLTPTIYRETILNHKSYKFRIYPTKDQESYLAQCFGAKRFIYNHFLWMNNQRYENKERFLDHISCSYIITDMKNQDEYSWMRSIDDKVFRSASNDLYQSFKNFFNSIKKKTKQNSKNQNSRKKITINRSELLNVNYQKMD